MSHIASKRILREINDISQIEESYGLKLDLKENSKTELRGEIAGPQGTVYEGGRFVFDISLPCHYPFVPPEVKFVTKIWHPNIDFQTGQICLDILENHWSALMGLRVVLLSIQCLLAEPGGYESFLNAFVAKQYISHYEVFKQTARHWTNVFAEGSNKEPELEKKIEEMKAWGFEEEESRIALSNNHWVINDAITSFATD